MKKLLSILFLFFIFSSVYPQSNWKMKAGLNYSYFITAKNSAPKIGYSLGIVREFRLFNNFFISGEVDFTSRGAILKNRSIEPYAGNLEKQDAYSWDIHGFIGYLEFPMLIKYCFPKYKQYNFAIFMGPSYSIPVIDISKFEKRRFIEEYDPINPSVKIYDYNFGQESGFGNNTSSFIFNFGFDLSYSNYFFELRYVLDKREIYNFSNLSEVYEKLNSFQILFGKML